jgi:hypothetical protein
MFTNYGINDSGSVGSMWNFTLVQLENYYKLAVGGI